MNMEFNNTRRSNFLGHDGFIWWIGVIENRLDPLNLGRCQVRIKGLHSEKITDIPTASLPWAQPLFPVNNSFSTPSTLKEGDMVMGFFMDGDQAQYPIIFGMFHGIPEDAANPNSGFNDQRTDNQLKSVPKKPKSIKYNTNGSGVEITESDVGLRYPDILNEPTTDRLSRNESIDKTIVKNKKDTVVKVTDAVGNSWSEPETPYNTVYPYNQVLGTESGHYLEFDDSPGSERVHLYHRSGTFFEIHQDGSKVDKVSKNKYSIVMGDDNVYVMGDCSITVQGNAKVYVQQNCNLKVDGNLDFNVAGNWTNTVGGNAKFNVGGNADFSISGDLSTDTSGTTTINSGADVIVTASNIRLN